MAKTVISYQVAPAVGLTGDIQLPGDKSISHRALLLAAIAEGISTIHNLLMGADNLATLGALQQLGITILTKPGVLEVEGHGLNGLRESKECLDLGNSGTGLRLLTGILAGQSFSSRLTGDKSLRQRPMARIIKPLEKMGATINASEKDTLPFLIVGGKKLRGIHYEMPIASAQVKSCLLLAGLYAEGSTTIVEPVLSRDHTERMLQLFSCPITQQNTSVTIASGAKLQAVDLTIPGDISSAAFFMVAACITKNSKLCLQQVGINPTRIGIINILKLMGADIIIQNEQPDLAEPIADIIVRYSELRGIVIPAEYVVSAIDEFPIIFIAAACAKGQTILRGASELRVKETDRIVAMAEGLTRVGIQCEVLEDGLIIEGGTIQGGEINSYGDHRIAMAFAVAANAANHEIIIQDCENVTTSFPNFVALAKQIGMNIKESVVKIQ